VIAAQAWLFLLLGGWLGWRELRDHPAAAQMLLGKAAPGGTSGQPWGLLLLPLILALSVLAAQPWWSIPLLAISVLIIRSWPRLAGQLAAAGTVAFGAVGVVGAQSWYLRGVHLVAAPGLARHPIPGRSDALYGLVLITNQGTRIVAELEGVILVALGCWLVPRTFPAVGRMLGLAPNLQLTRQVQRLTESRAVAVDTAASDLRRLERDLHDGAQARLVALGMNLRAAERLIPVNPDAALALVAEARDTSARALIELRELVRGVHPPVLADRGLGDAVRALALDCPLGVETDIDLPGRAPAPVETACYFAVAELLTNAAKHSGARAARVDVRYVDGRLRVEVTDFGLGGADPSAGSGLAGVEKRLASFDGIMAISSPAGGPTIVALEVPCALSSPKTSTC
jgi:signal transduction histidine kinase